MEPLPKQKYNFPKTFIVLCLVIAAAPVAWARTTPDTSAVATLKHLEHTWQQAILTGNKQVLQTILSPRFLDTSYKGTMRTKTEMLAAIKGPKHYKAAISHLKVRVFDNAAILTGINTVTGPHKAWTARLRFTDVFIKHKGRWQAVGAQEALINTAGHSPGASSQKASGST